MLTKTKNGYGLGSYESIPGTPILDRKLSHKEAAVILYKVNRYTYEGAAEQMHCSEGNVNKIWQTIYFKLGVSGPNCSGLALLDLMRLGALKHLILCFIIFSTGLSGISSMSNDVMRPPRPSSARTRTRRQESDLRAIA